MSTDTREERLARRIADLYATDQQFADARPSEAVAAAIEQPGLRLPQIVQTVIDGYADRPALGQRAVEFVTDPTTGRTSAELLPRFDTITYRELCERVSAVAAALTQYPVQPGDRVAMLGFTSVDYTTIDMALLRLGAVSVPLQTSAPVAQLRPIVAETEPMRHRVERRLPRRRRRTDADRPRRPSGWSCSTTTPRSTTSARRSTPPRTRLGRTPRSLSRLWPTCSTAGTRCRPHRAVRLGRRRRPAGAADLHLRQHRRAEGRDVPENAWSPTRGAGPAWRCWGNEGASPSITLNFMPMSHVMGRGILYGTLGDGGTAYFAAKSDLSTLLRGPRAGAAHPVELRAADLGHAVRGVPERSGPAVRRRRRSMRPSRPTCWPTCARTCSAVGSSRR